MSGKRSGRIFVAGASGAIGRRLCRLLVDDGWSVVGTTRSKEKAPMRRGARRFAAKAPDGAAVLEAMLLRMRVAAAQAVDPGLEGRLPLPEKDRPVMSAAIRQGCAALVTGDRTHFGPLYGKTVEGVRIRSPRMIAEELL